MEVIFSWLGEHYPYIFVLLVGGIIAWAIFGIYHRFKHTEAECKKISTMESTINHSHAVSTRIEKSLDEKFLPKLDKLVLSINNVVIHMSTKDKDFKTELFVINSPVELSPIGSEILESIGGKKYIDSNKDSLIELMEKESLKSSLDVQNHAILLIIQKLDSDELISTKNYIYNNPVYKKENAVISLDTSIASQIMGIYLRNFYLTKHPEVKE